MTSLSCCTSPHSVWSLVNSGGGAGWKKMSREIFEREEPKGHVVTHVWMNLHALTVEIKAGKTPRLTKRLVVAASQTWPFGFPISESERTVTLIDVTTWRLQWALIKRTSKALAMICTRRC